MENTPQRFFPHLYKNNANSSRTKHLFSIQYKDSVAPKKTNTNSRFLVRQTTTDKKYIRNHSVIQTLWSILNSGSGVNAAAKTNGEEHCITISYFHSSFKIKSIKCSVFTTTIDSTSPFPSVCKCVFASSKGAEHNFIKKSFETISHLFFLNWCRL